MRLKTLTLVLSSLFAFSSASAADFSKETTDYRNFVIQQIDELVSHTEKFVGYLNAGDVANAKKEYALARMYYERSEPIAESFGDLDPRIDARLADLTDEAKQAGAKTDEEAQKQATAVWTGFHNIEKTLWETNSTKGTEKAAAQLVNDVKELRAKLPTAEVTPQLMVTGAVDLLNEVSTSKITGEEDIFSKTDLYDFKANIEGAEKIFELFKPSLVKKNAKLAKQIDKQFAAVNALLEKHNASKTGYEYKPYTSLTQAEIKELAEAVNKLGEPLAQMGVILEK